MRIWVPLAPSWVIGEKTRTVARLVPDPEGQRFGIEIRQDEDDAELDKARRTGTARDSRLHCPNCPGGQSNAIAAIRGDTRGQGNKLRHWENTDVVPRPDDIFQERLYCVRWRLPTIEALPWAEQYERSGKPYARPVPDWVTLDVAIAGLAELSPTATIAAASSRSSPAASACATTASCSKAARPTRRGS